MPSGHKNPISFHKSSPHIRCEDVVPVVVTRRIAGRETPCLRWLGETKGETIWRVLFFFPLELGNEAADVFQGEPTDYAVLFVGKASDCHELKQHERLMEGQGIKHDDAMVWLANMDRPHSFLAKTVAIGDPVCGAISPRGAWLADHYVRFFVR